MSRDYMIGNEASSSYIVGHIQSLSEDLAKATLSIAQNNIDDFEQSIQSQATTCAKLIALEQGFKSLFHDARARNWLTKALRGLKTESQIYSRLLAVSGESLRIRLALCDSYRSSADQASVLDRHVHGVSFEV